MRFFLTEDAFQRAIEREATRRWDTLLFRLFSLSENPEVMRIAVAAHNNVPADRILRNSIMLPAMARAIRAFVETVKEALGAEALGRPALQFAHEEAREVRLGRHLAAPDMFEDYDPGLTQRAVRT